MPGWGYWAKAGATTLWEQWDAGPSYNHIMFGDVSAWFYAWIAGIQQENDSVGFERIVFCPNPVGQLTSTRAHHLAPRGKVAIEWTLQGRMMHLSLEVPCGSSVSAI